MNDIASILHQFKKGLLSAEEVAEKSEPAPYPLLPIRTLITAAWNAQGARKSFTAQEKRRTRLKR